MNIFRHENRDVRQVVGSDDAGLTRGGRRLNERPRIPLLLVTLLALVAPLPCTAHVRIETWNTDNGLPQNSVTGLTQTREGYLWFTTNEGFVRFDGFRFTVYNRSNTPEITSNRLIEASTDRSGRIWMTTEEGEILFYDKGSFNIVKTADGLPGGVPSRIFDDPNGGIIFYIGYKTYSDKKRYEHFRYQDGQLVPLRIEGLPDDNYLVLSSREGGLWFAGEGVIRRFNDGHLTVLDLGMLGTGEINKMAYEDRQGAIWLGYSGQSQLLLRLKDGKVERNQKPPSPVSSFAEDPEGNLWISLLNNGVYRVDHGAVVGAWPVTRLLEPVALVDEFPHMSAGHLCADRDGGIWIGTNQGLLHLTSQLIRVFSRSDGLPEENVYPIYEDSAGRIWAGVWDNSLVRNEGGGFETFLRTEDTFYVSSLFEDRGGRFWVGTASNLYYLDDRNLVNFTEQAGFAAIAEFSVIAQDSEHNLWFGTDQGLSRYAGGHATLFTEKDGLPDDYIVAFLQGSDGKIWVGTRRGLAEISSGHITAFTTADGLASNYIRSLYEDSDGALWIGSYDGGLTRLKHGEFARVAMKEGLFSNGVFCILEDQRGWFWMNSNQGIFRVRKQELNDVADGRSESLTSIAYDREDGLLTVEGNGGRQPAGIKARDGRLWFPSARGIAVVDPAEVPINDRAPAVLIEGIVVDGDAVATGELQTALSNASEIVLTPDQNNLEIAYTGISFINSDQVRFKYTLEGQDRDWVDARSRRTAYYSYLPPGKYTFRVIAANRDGVWNSQGAYLRIRVLPPFYKTSWFISLSVLMLACAAWVAYQGRVHQLMRQERKLRAVVETIPATTWSALPDGSVDFISNQWRKDAGVPGDVTPEAGWKRAIHPEDMAAYVERWQASLVSGELFECEARLRSGLHGEYRWFLSRAVPLRDARGGIFKWYGIWTDIEERKRAEAELDRLRQLQSDLAHTNRLSILGELTASLAHEINQPITATITNARAGLRWLSREHPDLDEARAAIERIEAEGRRTAGIIARLRAFYRKGESPRREPVDVNEVIREMLELLRIEAKRCSVVMKAECAVDRPVVRADRVQLQQVLMNLMMNGIEAMQEQTGELKIKTEVKDGHVIVSVSDTGSGLPAEGIERIFESFFTTKTEGTGMGLSISRSIIEAHGGRLWANDNRGPGATFCFMLRAESDGCEPDESAHEA